MNSENYIFYISSLRGKKVQKKKGTILKKRFINIYYRFINISKILKIVSKKKIKLCYIILYHQIKLNYIKYCMHN